MPNTPIPDKVFRAIEAFASNLPWSDPMLKEASLLAHQMMEIRLEDFDMKQIQEHKKSWLSIMGALYHLNDLHRIIMCPKSLRYREFETCLEKARCHYQNACDRFGLKIEI